MIMKRSDSEIVDYFQERRSEMLRYALSFNSQIDQAEDAVGELMLKMWKNKEKLSDPEYNLRAWMYACVRNTMINHYRRNKKLENTMHTKKATSVLKNIQGEGDIDEVLDFYVSEEGGAENTVCDIPVFVSEIESMIDEMNPRTKKIFKMFLNGWLYRK